MKKPLIVLLLFVCVFVAGFILGDRSWERMRLFPAVVVKPQALMPDYLSHFLLAETPPFSSDHYYFREGFTDVNEYWSFCLPPEQAKAFLSSYTARATLPLAENPGEIPNLVLGPKGQSEWDDRYWFHDFDQLDQVYYKRLLFCGYSTDRNRLYLMNWDE
jgi:hypothetical protein